VTSRGNVRPLITHRVLKSDALVVLVRSDPLRASQGSEAVPYNMKSKSNYTKHAQDIPQGFRYPKQAFLLPEELFPQTAAPMRPFTCHKQNYIQAFYTH